MNKAERVDVSQLIADCRAGRVDYPAEDVRPATGEVDRAQ